LNITAIGSNTAFLNLPITNSPALSQGGDVSGQSFGTVLKSFAQSTVNALQASEQTAISAIQNNGSIQNAVMATMEAEQSLQATLAIRDKVVSAFLEISRMQI